ncbi:unnamed protein product [Penicillium salamii]|uniref:Uncharacterized protein n=1 Tax=Penicillium salamii TaxID=1612424 RepID=A0A9W4ICY3_9EURO|nr:unnamed protein product [Penicillium salamii]
MSLSGLLWSVISILIPFLVYKRYSDQISKFEGPFWAQYSSRNAVIQIAPNELHISDVELYKTLYGQRSPFMKSSKFYNAFLVFGTTFGKMDPHKNRERRKLLNPFFSKAGTLKLEPVILHRLSLVLEKMERLAAEGPINVQDALRCYTGDIVSQVNFGKPLELTSENPSSFKANYFAGFDAALKAPTKLFFNPLLRLAYSALPFGVLTYIDYSLSSYLEIFKFSGLCFLEYKERKHTAEHPILFDNLSSIPESARTTEAMSILIAGSETTAFTLAKTIFLILSSPRVKEILVRQLDAEIPESGHMPSIQDFEKLDYLMACVKEGLRHAMGVSGRLPRVVPNGVELFVEGKPIPPGTIVSMSAYTMHRSEEIWGPDALEFVPEHWLKEDSKSLEHYLVSFSKGARQCTGMNLAYTVIVAALAHTFRKFELTLKTQTVLTIDRFVQMIMGEGICVDLERREN